MSYYSTRQALLDNWIIPAHGDKLLVSLRDTMIEDFALDIPRSDSLRNRVIITYRIVLREACRQHLIDINPADNVPLINERNVEREAFTPEEMAVLFPDDEDARITVWGSLMWAAYFSVLADTGFRPGEAAAVRKENFFPQHKGIFVTKSINAASRETMNRIKTTGKGQDYKIGKLSSLTCILLLKQSAITLPDGLLFRVAAHPGLQERAIIPDVANKQLS